MNFDAQDYYTRTNARDLHVGAIYRDVPFSFFAGSRLRAVQPVSEHVLSHSDFAETWQRASPEVRDQGIPVLQRAKLRPAILLRVGAAIVDTVHGNDLWFAPTYTWKERRRSGPNIFPLPSEPTSGLVDGFVDFYHLQMIPRQHVSGQRYVCTLTSQARQLLVAALVLWAQADPP